jgi:5'-deoxynucleotidase YfbR-like HD superfamily hydrolase
MDTVITTFSGSKVNYLKPTHVDLDDIALGLSRMPRFAGQTPRVYSVAQHCILVGELCSYRLYGLIHDAQEALLCDLPTPAKEALRALGSTAYDDLEDRLYRAICKEVGLPARWPSSVKVADEMAYRLEVAAFREGKRPDPNLAAVLKLKDGGREEWLAAVRAEMRERVAA